MTTPTQKPDHVIAIRVTEQMRADIKALADRHDRSVTAQVRTIITAALEADQ